MKCMGLGTCEEGMPMPKMNHGKFPHQEKPKLWNPEHAKC
jgi:hypothetical protein